MERKNFIKFFLVLFLLVVYIWGCHKPTTNRQANTTVAGPVAASNIPQEKISENQKDTERFTALINRLDQRNPLTKEHAGVYKLKMASGTLHLGGILSDGQKPMAIINNQIVRVGDIIEDKEVINITPEEVVLKDRQEERTYKLEVIK